MPSKVESKNEKPKEESYVSEEELEEESELNKEEQENMLNSLKQLMAQQKLGQEDEENDEDDEDDDDFEVEDEQDLGDLMNTYFYDSEKNRNIVDVAIEIKRCFEKQNQILLKLVTVLQNKK